MLNTSTGSFGQDFFISRNTSSPLRPGMVMSRTTTSQTSFQIRVSASCALLASPKTARLNSSARICFKPCRTTAWSSAIRILIMTLVLSWRSAEGDGYNDSGSLSRPAGDVYFSAEKGCPFAHAQKPDGFDVGDLFL